MRIAVLLVLLTGAFSTVMQGQDIDIDVPLRSWTVPSSTPAASGGVLTTMTDVTSPRVFIGVAPCRVADTRGIGGFSGQAGQPVINTGSRTFQIAGTVPGVTTQCGIPSGAQAVSFQFTIVSPNTAGNLIAWPAGGPLPTISVLNWDAGITALGNGTIVPLSAGGALSVRINAAVGSAIGHLVIDVNGYFSETIGNAANYLRLENDNPGFATAFFRNSASANNSSGVFGFVGPSFLRPNYSAAGVRGDGIVNGVAGISQQLGVAGSLVDESGGERAFGILGFREGSRRIGAHGSLPDLVTFGSLGVSDGFDRIGVVGESRTPGDGVFGVIGRVRDAGGTVLQSGILGWNQMSALYGVYSVGNAHVQGAFSATSKNFVQPHPHDASKEIRYASLEGPQTEVYFRGTAQVSQGVTRISIPEHFRFVADAATYSTLVTPVGAMATVAVLSEGPEGIVLQASRNVKVHYVVYAEREAVRNADPITENIHFRPIYGIDFQAHLPDSFRQLMIQNGTLNSDGTINVETARRLGWDRQRNDTAQAPE